MRGSLAVSLVGSILIAACSVAPKWQGRDPVLSRLPVSKNVFLAAANLIEIHEVDPTISIDLRYTRQSAIARRPLYPPNMKAFLRPETAVRLRRANNELKGYGYRIQVWDAYRPPAAQLILWEASGFDDRFVANPHRQPSQHSCGTAVDVTLVTLSGQPVEMPTGFDSFTPEAAANYRHPNAEILERKKILQRAMIGAGFYPLPNEWWHFTDRRYKAYPETIALPLIQQAL